MDPIIITLHLKVPCYLIKTSDNYVLIDTGDASDREQLVTQLGHANVSPENLKLVILTHGDFDHSGNAAFLHTKYSVKIGMHASDSGMVELGDMGVNRKSVPDRITIVGRIIMLMSKYFIPRSHFDSFKPDILLTEQQDLSLFGIEAKIIEIPGHSKGSIGVLTGEGSLFCGDLLMNMIKPDIHFVIDDYDDFISSINKLKNLNINMVYPGHGKPFLFKQYIQTHL